MLMYCDLWTKWSKIDLYWIEDRFTARDFTVWKQMVQPCKSLSSNDLLSIPFNKLPYTAGWTVLLRIVIVIVVSKHVLVLTRIKQKKLSWDSKASWSLVLDRLRLDCLRPRQPQQRPLGSAHCLEKCLKFSKNYIPYPRQYIPLLIWNCSHL